MNCNHEGTLSYNEGHKNEGNVSNSFNEAKKVLMLQSDKNGTK